jgi:hypothetical protein
MIDFLSRRKRKVVSVLRVSHLIWLSAVMLLLTGCDSGPRRMRLWGEVSFENQPITEGTIVFTPVPSTKGPSTGASIRDGKYEVPEAAGGFLGGVYRVEISALRRTGKKIPSFMIKDAPDFELSENYIPDRYNRESELEITVSEVTNENRFDFKL